MTPEEAEALAHRWHATVGPVVVGGETIREDPARLGELLAPDVVVHANGQEVRGDEAAGQLAAMLRTAFPDMRIEHHEALVAGERVVIRWTAAGTHRGDYLGVPASGRPVRFEGLDLFHLRDGRLAELWIEYDNLGFVQQVGAIPATGPAT